MADKEKNEEKQPVQSCEDGASLQERTQHECAPPFEPEPETQISEISAVSADEKNTTGSPTMNAINHLADEGNIASIYKYFRGDASIYIKMSEIGHSPLLRFWAKHFSC